jgi:hypothetical protein
MLDDERTFVVGCRSNYTDVVRQDVLFSRNVWRDHPFLSYPLGTLSTHRSSPRRSNYQLFNELLMINERHHEDGT